MKSEHFYEEALKNADLTGKEAEIYLTLLRLGEVPIAAVLKETGSHPQVVYSTLKSLTEKGLVLSVERRGKRYVQAESPEILARRQHDKADQLDRLIPALQALTHIPPESLVRVSRGPEAVQTLRFWELDSLSAGETTYVLGGSGQAYREAMGERYEEYDLVRIRKGIRRKMLSYESQKAYIEQHHSLKESAEFRYLPDKLFGVPSTTVLFKGTTAIIIWEKDPIIITIESLEVTKQYLHYFEELWEGAER